MRCNVSIESYGDEIGLSGADDPFNREPYPWDSEETWNTDIFSYTTKYPVLSQHLDFLNTSHCITFRYFDFFERPDSRLKLP